MIKEKLKALVETPLNKAITTGKLGALSQLEQELTIENPKLPEHGDFACSVAMKLAGKAKMPPLKIAQTIVEGLNGFTNGLAKVEVAPPGFINFRVEPALLNEVLQEIHQKGSAYGCSRLGNGKKVLLEYVSANPTGALHIGHGRGAVYGSCLANLMNFAGFNVEEEFYINDAGEQIMQLGQCAWSIYCKHFGKDVAYPEKGYPQEYLEKYVNQVIAEQKDKHLSLADDAGARAVGDETKALILEEQKQLLEKLGVHFKTWFSETPLHSEGKVEQALQRLRQSGLTYDSEGAFWLKAKELGDERDRVLVKKDSNKTYLAADAAYHLNKYERGFDLLINIWGADHHGQIPGLKAVVKALGQDETRLEIILTQIVNLQRNGQLVRMSKRQGTVVFLEELIDEVGRDAVRYYLAESSPQNSISFDLELAKKSSKENPAFYIQYAHARCCAIVRKAQEETIDTVTGKAVPAAVTEAQLATYMDEYKKSADIYNAIYDENQEVFKNQKSLIMTLARFPEEVEEAALTRQPGRIARYAYDLANDLQRFYESSRVISSDEKITKARLGLVLATKQVLANALGIIGVTAVERM